MSKNIILLQCCSQCDSRIFTLDSRITIYHAGFQQSQMAHKCDTELTCNPQEGQENNTMQEANHFLPTFLNQL